MDQIDFKFKMAGIYPHCNESRKLKRYELQNLEMLWLCYNWCQNVAHNYFNKVHFSKIRLMQ